MKKFLVILKNSFILCVLFGACFIYFFISMFILPAFPLSDKERQDDVIRYLQDGGIIPSDISFDTKYCTRQFRENTFVFSGVVTNISFLLETNATERTTNTSKNRWIDARPFHKSNDALFVLYGHVNFLNHFIKKANIPFECTLETPLFRMNVEHATVWCAIFDNRIVVIYDTY